MPQLRWEHLPSVCSLRWPLINVRLAVLRGNFSLNILPFGRACKSNESNYHRIVTGVPADHGAAGALYLGLLPNRLQGFGEHLVEEREIVAVLSLNEPWERETFGVSLPYSGDDWDRSGVDYCGLDVYDHHYLSLDQLDTAADFIHGHLSKGENVYVHCRAGQGRSSMAIAAYLIKYEGLSADAAAGRIKGNRPISTIQNKLDVNKFGESGLYDYETLVNSR